MPTIAPLTIATVVYSPSGIKGDIASYEARAGGVRVGYPTLTASVISPQGKSKLTRVRFRLNIPTLETLSNNTSSGINPAPTKAYDSVADLIFTFNERSTAGERGAIAGQVIDLLVANWSAFASKLIVDQEPVY